MVCGTASDAGKSTLVTGLCRVLARRGWRVAPFKAQNMALNSAVTASGHEIGRAQAAQAHAGRVEAEVAMNPILLKPTDHGICQVVAMGRPWVSLDADFPALLVGDIDRGGVFASLFGTVALLPQELASSIAGFVINKFRGDPSVLAPGLAELQRRTGVATVGCGPGSTASGSTPKTRSPCPASVSRRRWRSRARC